MLTTISGINPNVDIKQNVVETVLFRQELLHV